MSIKEILLEILEKYPLEYQKDNKANNLYFKDFKNRIQQTFAPLLDEFGFTIKALGGQGVMRRTPYISFLAEGQRTSRGIYPIYQFDLQQQTVCLDIGDANEQSPPAELVRKFAQRSAELLPEFEEREEDGYPRKLYTKSELNEESLRHDLHTVFEIYQSCLEEFADGVQSYIHKQKATSSAKPEIIWVIQAGTGGELWEEWQQEEYISIGWSELGDPTELNSVEEIRQTLLKMLPQTPHETFPHSTQIHNAHSVNNFVNEMQIGDLVAAVKGRHTLLGIGRIIGEHEYRPEQEFYENSRTNRRKVTWLKTRESFLKRSFPIKTLTPFYPHSLNYQKIMEYWKGVKSSSFVISAEHMDGLWKRFHRRIPGFTNFPSPGPAFLDEEINDKRKALQRYKTELGYDKVQELLDAGEGQIALQEISERIAANLVQPHSWRQSIGETDEQSLLMLRTFLQTSQKEYEGPETLAPIFEQAIELGLNPSWDTYSVLLWAMRPIEYAPIKISSYRKLAKELGHTLPGGRPTPGTFDIVLQWMQTFWGVLQDYQPSDWIDVQSFIWCVCPNAKKETPFPYPEANAQGLLVHENSANENSALDIPLHQIHPYTKEHAFADLFLEEEEFDGILNLLRHKKNIILQGPPGVGKSFIAKKLAYTLVGFKDDKKIEMIQFHQAYAYEDFIQGFRPNEDGTFELKNGVFYEFCKRAHRDRDEKYVFIIDEINRGNLSKIFGELMLLIEPDKRSREYQISLTYGKDKFFIPPNLFLIGMMNTADRSLAMVDYALRRRFRFVNLTPQFKSAKFRQFLQSKSVPDSLIEKIQRQMTWLNEQIADNPNLGEGYCVGHSFFCPTETSEEVYDKAWYQAVIDYEIAPLIREYWFDDRDNAAKLIQQLQ